MRNLSTVEIKAFVPSKDFEQSKRFYRDLGFDERWSSSELAYFCAGQCSFLLQNFYSRELAENFMMQLLVEDVDAWWQEISMKKLDQSYGATVGTPADRPWGVRDFTVHDPSGVLWRIGQNMESATR